MKPGIGKILFVDDDASLRTVVKIALSRDGHTVDLASGGEEALAMFQNGGYNLVIQDVRMPGMNGLELLERLRTVDETIPIVVMTAFSSWDIAVEAMRRGAFDYVKKPFDNDELRVMAGRAIIHFQNRLADNGADNRLVGTSPAIQSVRTIVEQVAENDSTVCISGESGTGKELVAALLHSRSPRREGPFVAVNCGGFSETLLESELFGHVRGAFTGAVAEKRGLIGLADGGTFFLDEIGEMTLPTQVRLLRVLETRTYYPVGGEAPLRSDVRFITATNRDLPEMVEAGAFRRDLYYRLNVIPIRVPPLRERKDDIPLLAGYFLHEYSRRLQKSLTGFDVAAMDAMLAYEWPGNVRELQNAVHRAAVLARSATICFEDILPNWSPRHSGAARQNEETSGSPADLTIPQGFDLERHLSDIEAEYIRRALDLTGNNLTQAAELLGISFRSIRYKVKKLKI